jgi:hypothetical protein
MGQLEASHLAVTVALAILFENTGAKRVKEIGQSDCKVS